VSGWVDWNLVLDLKGGPNWVNFTQWADIIVNKTSQEYYKEPIYYAVGHFSKFIVPNSVKVQSTEKAHLDKFETTVFVRPDNGTVVIALNLNCTKIMYYENIPAAYAEYRLNNRETVVKNFILGNKILSTS
jgi:glucosylceramidase